MNFRNLEVWKRSVRLSAELYQGLRGLKDYGFKDQITRSGLSVPSNIAEGYGRGSVKETIQFLHYAKGSCAELQTQIIIGIVNLPPIVGQKTGENKTISCVVFM